MQTQLDYAKRILALLRPKPGVHGVAATLDLDSRGLTYQESLTPEWVVTHLRGERRYGYALLHADGTCCGGCIDVDTHGRPPEEGDAFAVLLAARIKDFNLPLHLRRSKRGGIHLECFAKSPVPGTAMNGFLDGMLERLGLPPQPTTEIFPKGDGSGAEDGVSVGGWVYLPFFGALAPGGIGAEALESLLRSAELGQVLAHDVIASPAKATKRSTKAYEAPGTEGGRYRKLVSAAALIARTNPDASDDERMRLLEGENARLEPPFTVSEFKSFKFLSWFKKLRRKQDSDDAPASANVTRDELIVETGAEILEDDDIAQDELGQVYRYDKEIESWVFDKHKSFAQRLKVRFLARKKPFAISDFDVNRLVKHLSLEAPQFWTERPLDRINLKNGILNVETGILEPHSHAFLYPGKFPHLTWDPDAQCPFADHTLGQIVQPDEVPFVYELLGYSLVPDARYQACFLFQGAGSNGKGVILRLIEYMLGAQNCSSVTLHDMESDRFAIYAMHGKLVNIEFDLKLKVLPDTGAFKTITAGETVSIQRKYCDQFPAKLPVRLFIGCNHFPRSLDTSHGFYRRFRVLPFKRQFKPGDAGFMDATTMHNLLVAESAGILAKSVRALKVLRERAQFTESQNMRNGMLQFQLSTDILSTWLSDNVVEGIEMKIAQRDLRAAFNRHAHEKGFAEIDEREFAEKVLKYRAGVIVRVSHGTSYFAGIGMKFDPSYGPPPQQSYQQPLEM